MQRKICPICQQHPVAINYYRHDRVYFRTSCTPCIHRAKKAMKPIPGWVKAGYKKRERCDRCNFKFKSLDQSCVYYVDGNTKNNHWANLRTICANCRYEVVTTTWKPGEITADF